MSTSSSAAVTMYASPRSNTVATTVPSTTPRVYVSPSTPETTPY